MSWWRKGYCSCGSGKERGFCSHRDAMRRDAMRRGALNGNKKRVPPRPKSR